MAESETPNPNSKPPKTRASTRFAIGAIVVLLIAGIIGFLFMQRNFGNEGGVQYVQLEGTFRMDFEGCDDADRCGEFVLYAPGKRYSWAYNKMTFDAARAGGSLPDFAQVLDADLRRAEGVIASGLASREGSSFQNAKLSSCRSKALAREIVRLQRSLGTNATIYRTALGRYGEDVAGSGDTAIERLIVLGFILEAEEDIDLGQAWRNGLTRNLADALQTGVAPEIARQLDFTKYECWGDDFEITNNGILRTACYRETSLNIAAMCGEFD